jgi:tRNA (guanine-N7-)-methyltransferase
VDGELLSRQPELRQKLLSIARRKILEHPFILQPDESGQISRERLAAGHPADRAVLELGAGSGEFLAAYAAMHPEELYVAFEIKWDRIRLILKQLQKRGLTSVRIVPVNFSWLLESLLPPSFFDTVIIYFPDPWPKKRHWKHRLVQKGFPDRIVRLLKPGGSIHLATDYGPYARRMLGVFNRPDFQPLVARPFFSRTNPFGIQTRFESITGAARKPYFMAFQWTG